MQRYIDNRSEIGDTLTLRPLIRRLREVHPESKIAVRTDPHGLLSDLDVKISESVCPVCGETEYSEITGTPYVRCVECNLWYQRKPPEQRWENPVNENRGHLMSERDQKINDSLAESIVKRWNPTAVLDVGSKYPFILKCFNRRGVATIRGIDGCAKALEYGRELGVPMVRGDFLKHDFGRRFDLVTMIHVIEHFADPRLAVRMLKRVLERDGRAFIRTPDTDGNVERDLTAGHYLIHPVLFNRNSLRKLFEEEGFEIDDVDAPCDGQIDMTVRLVDPGKRCEPILHQWTQKNPRGDYLRRKYHFYAYPELIALEVDWSTADTGPTGVSALGLPPLPDGMQLPKDFIAIAHQTGGKARQWPIHRWRRVAEWLLKNDFEVAAFGTEPLGVEGVHETAGKLSVKEAIATVESARLVLSADTMLPHVATSLEVPSLVLMGPADAAKTFCNGTEILYRPDGGCTRCYHRLLDDKPYKEGEQPPIHYNCQFPNSTCMEAIPVIAVIERLRKLLDVPKPKKLLSVCMIVRNEEKGLADALESVHAGVDEIIIADTGSTDKTKEIAGRFPKVRLFDYDPGESFDDFSAARNFAFSKAVTEYVMWLDAGDRAEDIQAVRKALRGRTHDVLRMKTVFGGSEFIRERVCLREFAQFVDRVHETMVVHGLRDRTLEVVVNHFWQDKLGREDSLERNVRLLRKMIEETTAEHPRYPRWTYYLARELKRSGNQGEALKWFRTRAALEGFTEERYHAACAVATTLLDQKKYMEAIRAGYDAMKLCDGYRDPYYVIGDAYYWLGNYSRAAGWFHHALTIPRPSTSLWVWEDIYTYLCHCQLSYCYEKMGDLEQALHWAEEELKAAPESQRDRIRSRIKQFKAAKP